MDENTFSLKCETRTVKVHYDSGEHISVIKIYPEQKSDIKIAFGGRRVTINDGRTGTKQEK